MTKAYKRTLTDIDFIISNIDEELRNKIPIKLRNIIRENKLNEYNSTINMSIPIEEQSLHPDTIDYLTMLYLNYWCDDESEKEKIQQILQENESKEKEKYSYDKIFENNINKKIEEKNNINMPILIKKQLIFERFIIFIKNVFNKNRN